VQRRCIPIDNIDVKFVVETVVSGSLELLFDIIGNFTDDLKYREVALFTNISTFLDRCIYRQMLSGTDILTCVSLIQTCVSVHQGIAVLFLLLIKGNKVRSHI